MNNNATLWASGGFKLINSDITHNNNKVFLEGGANGSSYFENSDLRADIVVNNKVTIKNSIIRGSVSNVSNHEIVLESDSWVTENVDGGTKITISDSQVNGRVTNRTNNEIEIKDESVVWGRVDAGSKITIDDSTVNSDVSNRTLNEIEVKNDSTVQGDVDGGSKVTIDDSEVAGDVSNRSNNEIIITDESRIGGSVVAIGQLSISESEIIGNIDSTNHNINLDDDTVIRGNATAANNNWATIYFKDNDSVVHGTCLYRTDPIDACQPRGLSPLAQYHFDKNSWGGGNVFDVTDSAGSFNGKAVNQPNLNHNPFEPALINDFNNFGTCGYAQFSNSDNSYVEVQHSSELSFEEELSVSVWIKLGDRYPQGNSLYTIVAKDTNYEFHINNQGKIYWYWLQKNNHTRTLTSNIVIEKNEWYHIVIDYKSNRKNSQAKLYINGALDNSVGDNGNKKLKKNNELLRIGNDANFSTRSFNGYIDEINIFNRSLSPNEVKELYRERHLCDPIDNNLLLVVEPKVEYVLTCEVSAVEFKVVDDDGNVISTVQDSFTASHTPNSTGKWCEDENGNRCSTSSGDYQSHFVNGQKTLYLSSYKLESYDVSGTWNDDLETAASQINFVPYKFDVDEQFVVAGDGYEVTAKVSSCNTQDSSLSQDYVGTPKVSLDIVQPANGNDAISLLDYTPDFEVSDKGETTDTLSIQESGQFKVTLTDSTFDCSEISGCPESGIDKLSGSFSVYSRPWQFAICTNKSSDGNSKEKGSDSFVAAGELFDVYARPIKYTNSSSVCSDDNLLTNNYFKSTASVQVTTTLETPSTADYPDAELGDLTPEIQLTKQISPNDQTNKGYKFESLKYSEVGSFNFVATEAGSFYGSILGGFSGSKSIGRFYPKYFVQDTPEWNVANQGDISYLDQPYDSAVHQVYPMASGESSVGNVLNNYRFFHPDLQAEFGVLDDTAVDNRFLLDTGSGTWSTDRKHWLLNDSAAVLERVTDSDSVSRKDNPFNTSDANSTVTHFGLTVDGVDPVSFTDSDTLTDSVEFLVQPPARYGRMALDDIGGNSDTTLTIPLRSEFWDGNEFVVNEDDDRSTFNGANVCKQVIWHSEGATTTLASLNGSGSVDDGEKKVTANQNTPTGTDSPREQVRLWLRMDDSEPESDGGNNISCSGSDQDQPWLRYNWRQLGDEDPSTVITFGIYRGNDRVIYRGESGLTGQ
ncbi:LamG domain-containing protein [Vibrio kanaloae]|uniref:LamG domain-containing protein n=1 Tax=Vibrio kanaloae TaxID=170673 RepID=UPI0021BCFC5C|nr:LamG domain-containing protein [Vibrio kanaloae]